MNDLFLIDIEFYMNTITLLYHDNSKIFFEKLKVYSILY